MDEIDDYVFNHLPIEGVSNIVTGYNKYLFGFFKSEYTKYYKEKKDINYSFFKVLDKCKSEYGGFTITITANGELQTFEKFKQEKHRHKQFEQVLHLERKYKKKESPPKYTEWKNKEQERINQYNDTLKIIISYKNSCVLYLTNTNWNTYNQEEKKYNNLLFMGPVTNIGSDWLFYSKNLNIDFTGLTSLEKVGNNWLFYCKNLVNVNVTCLTSLQEVGDNWLNNCHKLTSINFRGLTNLQTVGNFWLCECTKLLSVDFRGLTSLKTIGNYWCYQCNDLKNIYVNKDINPNIKDKLEILSEDTDVTVNFNFSVKKKSPIRRKSSKKKSPIRRKSSKKKSPIRRKLSKKKSPIRRKSSKKKSPIRRKSSKKKSPIRRKLSNKKLKVSNR